MPFTLKQIEALGDLYHMMPIKINDLIINQFYYFLSDLGDTTTGFNLRNKQYPKYYPRVVWVGNLRGIKHDNTLSKKKTTLVFSHYGVYKGKKGTTIPGNQATYCEIPLENLIGQCLHRKNALLVRVRTSLPVMLPEKSSKLSNVTTVADPLPVGLIDPLTFTSTEATAIAQEIDDLQAYYDNQYD